jgi:hypothetical protein
MSKVPIARLWHKKGKLEYFCIQQMIKTFPNIDFDWHIVLHSPDHIDEWSKKIDELPIKATWYSTKDMLNYAKDCGYITNDFDSKISNFVHFYHIIIFHYLRRVLRYDYALAYEYDIIFNSNELEELEDCIKNKIPFGICEPANSNCDKALINQLNKLFGTDIANMTPYFEFGINAGFQGMNLKLFDNFMNPSTFIDLLNCFDFSGIYKEDGSEKIEYERTIIDTQEQSFHSLLNRLFSDNFHLLTPRTYYFYPSYLDLNIQKKSKILHYFGHTKPKEMIDFIENKLVYFNNKTK